jgi:curved DNA-binding protein CbpA
LGVTPRATTEQIRRAYRRKAKEVHPDQHHADFSTEAWDKLMTLISDAERVLTDKDSRRAYDIIWVERSHEVARRNRAEGEHRGDWETRYRWEIAELSELEDTINQLLEEIASPPEGSDREVLGATLERAIEFYESELLEIRSQTHTLPPKYEEFGKVVRTEMQRKDHLVRELQRVKEGLLAPGAPPMAPLLGDAARVLDEVRLGQHEFDIIDFRSLR